MKNIAITFLSLVLFSCNQDGASYQKKLSENKELLSPTDNMEILGDWAMCSSSENGAMVQSNVCPTVSFSANGSGVVGNSSLITDRFSWKFYKGRLDIFTNGKALGVTFSDTFYFAGISTENNLKKLVISATQKESLFYLSGSFSN